MSSSNQTIVLLLAMASQVFVVCDDLTHPAADERAVARAVRLEPATGAEPPAQKAPKRFVACHEPELP